MAHAGSYGPSCWGRDRVEVGLPFGSFRFEGLSALQAERLAGRYARWAGAGPAEGAHVVCTGHRLPGPLELPSETFSAGGEYAPLVKRTPDGLNVTGFDFTANVRWGRPSRASLAVAREEDLPRAGVVENVLRMLAGYLALDRGGLLLHSAGLVLGGAACLFVGRSGAGKTTLTRKAHAHGVPVLSDDINVLLPDATGYRAVALPFAGEFGESFSVPADAGFPLGALFLLRQGSASTVRPVPPAEAAARILAACPFVNADSSRVETLMDRIADLMARTPVGELTSAREDGFDAIRLPVEAFSRVS